MPVRLLALDIDGTLLNSRSELTPRVRASLDAARARGVIVALATGRRFGSARELVQEKELFLDTPLISHNGALTKEVESLATISFHPLEQDLAHEIIHAGRDFGIDQVVCDQPEGHGVMVLENVSTDNKALHYYLRKYQHAVVRVPDLLAYTDHDPIQVMFSGYCDVMDEFSARLESQLNGRAQLFMTRYRSANLTILDVISPAASKGAGVAAIAHAHGIAREEVMAVGDNHNDLTMLRYAGVGVVMGNAEEELKQAGFAITASNEEDGVAAAVERFILQA
ncbi:MAG: Cof-type HAD-IIB family hydrolase [Blastocatellia bacterium]